jgi:hypothetical protein
MGRAFLVCGQQLDAFPCWAEASPAVGEADAIGAIVQMRSGSAPENVVGKRPPPQPACSLAYAFGVASPRSFAMAQGRFVAVEADVIGSFGACATLRK